MDSWPDPAVMGGHNLLIVDFWDDAFLKLGIHDNGRPFIEFVDGTVGFELSDPAEMAAMRDWLVRHIP